MTFLNCSTEYLEHADFELDHLMQQARFWRTQSQRFLRQAGLVPGMRVLDVGSGAGDFAFLAAEIVGATGSVISVDSSPLAIARCVYRAAELGVTNVKFIHSDIDSFDVDRYKLHELFDAVIGRMVLMYLPAPACTVQNLATCIAPGGLIAFQEIDMRAATADPPLPIFEKTMCWIRETHRQASVPISLGLHLHSIYQAAGLPIPSIAPSLGRARETTPCPTAPVFDYIVDTVHTLLPLMQRLGIATGQDVQIDTLAERLRDEATRRPATIIPPTLIGAWTRVPGGC